MRGRCDPGPGEEGLDHLSSNDNSNTKSPLAKPATQQIDRVVTLSPHLCLTTQKIGLSKIYLPSFSHDRTLSKRARTQRLLVEDNTVVTGLEPTDGLSGVDLVVNTNATLAVLLLGNTGSGTVHDDVEVHTVDTDSRVVLDTQVNVLLDTETEVTGLGEVALPQLVLLDLETTLEDLLGLGATDGDVNGDLLVTADTEGTDGVAGLGVDGGLTGKLLEDLGGTGETITRLTDTDVEDELGDAELAHGVGGLGLGGLVIWSVLAQSPSRSSEVHSECRTN
ncbi:hypothetical protein G7K_1399-t1 [Saitoella complicata NRRL Y-17804]|uniref:Uncharacterized protein n=1 Tax=Saitoella complicata (strain BCRC 22490 / CBS 7301 / JCM 7358 / NBRC 10748 / NRRL Y-17804) TaxID=698492 RepID=A0A0E9NBH4_SAICN|nr:hypothetical protein G7K_1399-t1 [Saitoella complicata NRRL Y-17804]